LRQTIIITQHLINAREKHSCYGYGQSAGISGGISYN